MPKFRVGQKVLPCDYLYYFEMDKKVTGKVIGSFCIQNVQMYIVRISGRVHFYTPENVEVKEDGLIPLHEVPKVIIRKHMQEYADKIQQLNNQIEDLKYKREEYQRALRSWQKKLRRPD